MGGVRVYINEKNIKKNGEVAVYVMVYMAGKSIKINTGVSVDVEKFDKKKRIVKGKTKEATDKNLIIENCLSQINEIQVRYRLLNKELTPELLIREYKNPTYYIDFYKWMEEKIKARRTEKEIVDGTFRHHNAVLNKLKKYKPALAFAEIDIKFIRLFRNFCRLSLKNDVNTVSKTLDTFNTYMNIALREELITVNPFSNFTNKEIEPQRIFLTEKELKTINELYHKKELPDHLQRTLRHFLFMCLTGLRISDFSNLRKENVQENVLKFTVQKSRRSKRTEIFIPLVAFALQLIEDENSQTGFVFDTISDQKMNEQLKDVSRIAKLNKAITNHSARHTFATLFLEKTDDVATLQKLLGHSNIRDTMVYVHISTKKITDQMVNFDQLLKL